MAKMDDVLFESAPDAIVIVDAKGIITRFNPQAEKLFGYAPGEIIGKPVEALIPQRYHENHENHRTQYIKLPVARPMGQCTGPYGLKKDGTQFDVNISLSPMKTNDGLFVVSIIRDTTNRCSMKDALQSKMEELSVHNEILRVIHGTRGLQEGLDLILKEIIRFLKVEHGALHLVQGDKIVLISHHNLPDNLRAHVLSIPLNAAPPWAKGTDIVNERLSEKGATPDFVKKEGIQSWVSVALHLPPHEKEEEGKWIGYLVVGSCRYNALQKERVSVVRKLVPQISVAIDNARNYRMAQERLVRLQILREIDKAIIQHLNIEDIMRTVLERIPSNFGADGAAICLVQHGTWKMETCVIRLPDGAECTESAFTLAESLLDKFINKKETVIIYDINEDPRLQMHLEHTQCAPFMSYLGVPLIVHNNTIGVLHVLTLQPKRFADEDVSFFRTLAGQTAIALENAQLFSRVKAQAETSAELVRQLEVAHEELRAVQKHIIQQERLGALGQMASGIAHDFNNALTPILGFTELLLLLPPKQFAQKAKNYLEIIKTSTQDAAETVKRLREFYREREKGEEFASVDMKKLIAHVIDITQPRWKGMAQIKNANILIRKELQDVPGIRGNEAQLREALTNLIFNAVDAMPDGGEIVISARSEETDDGKPCVRITVSDTGEGMTEKVKNRCLDPFFTTKKETGTGLGLSMVHGIIQRHGGKLLIESEPGKGTTFHIQLPVHEGNGGEKRGKAVDEKSARALSLLVVEDEPSIRMVLEEYAMALGHTAESAANVQEAKLWLQSKPFDAVITDRSMPGESGDRLAAFVKQKFPELPVILLTGFGDMMKAEGEKVEGVDEILSKPVTLSALRAALERVT